jgi:hypothetical protein
MCVCVCALKGLCIPTLLSRKDVCSQCYLCSRSICIICRFCFNLSWWPVPIHWGG